MRIWHLTKTLYGGAGQYVLRLSNALNSLGYQSTVLVAEGEIIAGVNNLSPQTNTLQSFLNRGLISMINRTVKAPFHSGYRLDRWKTNTSIKHSDIVHLHGMTGWVGFSGLRHLIPPQTKVFWTAHDLWMLSGGCVVYIGCNNYQSGCQSCPVLKHPFSNWSKHEWRYKAKFIKDYKITPIANSQWTANQIRESGFFSDLENIAIVPPIVASEFFEADSLPSLREELGLPADRIILGLGARTITDQYKGIPEFLERFSQELDLVDRCTLVICGDGELDVSPSLDCRFLGAFTKPEELARFYCACDVFISPSKMETFGMTLLEAQAAGTPVVAFRVGGTPEAVRHLEYGYLAAQNDYGEIISGLKWILSNLQNTRDMGINSSAWVKANFSSQVIAMKQANIKNYSYNSYSLSY